MNCFVLCFVSFIGLAACVPTESLASHAKSIEGGVVRGGKNPIGASRYHYKYNRDLDGYIRLYPVPANWFDARRQCQDHDGRLVADISNEARDALKRELFAQDVISDVFTGIASSGSSCTALTPTGSVRSVDCNEKLPFFCYREPKNKCGPKEKGYEYEPRTGSCYKFRGTALNWRSALLSCHNEGGQLVVINSEVESTILRQIFERKKKTITGSSNTEYVTVGFKKWNDGVWGTIHGNTLDEAGFSVWAAGEPNNDGGEEYCGSIFLNDGLYNDLTCHKPYGYICEIVP